VNASSTRIEAPAPVAASEAKPSLLGRIKQGVSKFFRRPTTPRH
jgi:hypothetical protein